jgi:hypothetical protein
MKHLFQFSIICLAFVSCTSSIPFVKTSGGQRIVVGPGPEDMVLDTFISASPRLLVSCTQRRDLPAYGEIGEIDLKTEVYKVLPRTNEPTGFVFRPHGFDLVKNNKNELLLYCISHNNDLKQHSILVYKVFVDHLECIEKMDNELLVSPNDVTADCFGNVFVTNDAGKRGSFMEPLLKLKHSNVISYNASEKKWKIIATGFSYANGIATKNCTDPLLLSTSRGDRLYSLKNSDGKYNVEQIVKLKGLDNITYLNDNEILITAHLHELAFLKHAKDSKNNSPSVVYRVNIKTGQADAIYANDGSEISGGSTALFYNGKLYISQIFEPFILKCSLEKN